MSTRSARHTVGWLLALLGLLTGFVVEDGDLSSIDSARRLQVTHSLWTGAPAVREGDYPGFGVVGRDGLIHAWYGIGQSVVMLPADVLGSLIVGEISPPSKSLKGQIKQAVLVYGTFPLLTAGCVALGYGALLQLGLGLKASALGAMGMLYGTTLLVWTQVNQENSLTLLCFLGTLYGCLRWLATGRLIFLAAAGVTAGFALLTRLPTVFETAAVGLLMMVLLFVPHAGEASVAERARKNWLVAGAVFGVVFALFVIAERIYQWVRFGSWNGTYIGIHQQQNPGWYEGGDWLHGVWTLLLSPHDSVLWMDPAILLCAVLLVFWFRAVPPSAGRLAAVLLALLFVLIFFYAPYPWPGGASGWGSRYTTTPSIVLGLLGFGFMAHLWRELRGGFKAVCAVIAAYALLAQLGSLLYWSNLEQLQWHTWGGETFLVAQRWLNAFALLGGNFGEAGLMVPSLSERVLRPNFMPFHVQAELGGPVGAAAMALWIVLVSAMVVVIVCIWRAISTADTDGRPS